MNCNSQFIGRWGVGLWKKTDGRRFDLFSIRCRNPKGDQSATASAAAAMSDTEAPNPFLREEDWAERDASPLLTPAASEQSSSSSSSFALPRRLTIVAVLGVLLVAVNMVYLKHSVYEEEQDAIASAAHDVMLHAASTTTAMEAPRSAINVPGNGTNSSAATDLASLSSEAAEITIEPLTEAPTVSTTLPPPNPETMVPLQETEAPAKARTQPPKPETEPPPHETEEPLPSPETESPMPTIEKPDDLSDPFTWALHKASLQRVANHSALTRGLVIPMYENIMALGLSLMLELRAMDVNLPIEVSHCGDLSDRSIQLLQKQDPLVRIYNVCEFAVQAKTEAGEPLFCYDIAQCHERFRSFDIKILSVVYSEFQELMIMDADTVYFQSPTPLWGTRQYVDTGTLFFHDRICGETIFLNEMKSYVAPPITTYEFFMSTFEVAKYRWLPTLARPSGIEAARGKTTPQPVTLPFEPSEFLLTSNTWNRRAGHEMDSSLVMWNKARQPRATAILASFVSLNKAMRPPSYGDKECFFIACELAETKYAFADFAVGNIGPEKRQYFEPSPTRHTSTALCGDMVQFFPQFPHPVGGGNSKLLGTGDSLLYLNSDNVLSWNPNRQTFFRTMAKPADRYEGSFAERSLAQICAFNVTIVELTPLERHRFLQRQKFHEIVSNWLE